MKRFIFSLTYFIWILFFFSSGCNKNQTSYEGITEHMVLERKQNYTMMIDAGIRFGTLSLEQKSKEIIVSSIADRLKNHLQTEGFEIALIRNADESISIKERTRIAREVAANVIISLTSNISQDTNLNSFYTLYEKIHANRQEHFGDTRRIGRLEKLFITEITDSPSIEYREDLGKIFYILKLEDMIHIIVDLEQVNHSRKKELLSTQNYQERISQALSKCIKEYLQLVEDHKRDKA